MTFIYRLAASYLMALVAAASSYAATPSTRQFPLNDVPTITMDGEEHLSGVDAVAHLQELQKTHKQLDKAAARLREMGYTPTENVSVIRSDNAVRSRSSRGTGFTHVQQRFSDADGELVFWEWDDGSDGTWGGVIYAENYSNGATVTWNSQMDVSTENFSVIWEDFVGGTPPSGGHLQTCAPDAGTPAGRSHQSAPQIASTSPAAAFTAMQATADVMLVQSGRSVGAYLSCVAHACMTYSRFCPFLGPGCTAARCTSGSIRCALLYL